MEALGVAASVFAVVQLVTECVKLSRNWLGPAENGSSERSALVAELYQFMGVLKSFQTHLEIYEDDEARLVALEYLKPALQRCNEALTLIQDFMKNAGVLGKYVIGPRFDKRVKSAVAVLDGAKELFLMAVHADQHTILIAVERYVRNCAEDIRDTRAALEEHRQVIHQLAESHATYVQGSGTWQTIATERLDRILDVSQAARDEAAEERRIHGERQRMALRTAALIESSANRQQAERDQEERHKIFEWLTPIDFAPQQSDFIRRRQADTGKWFLDSPQYQAWVAQEKKTIFCPGIPGAGKTILTATSVEYLEEKYSSDPSVGIAYIYFNYRTRHEQNAKDLLANLIKQLARSLNPLPDSLRELHHAFEHTRHKITTTDLSTTLKEIIRQYSRTFILLDALDEFQSDQRDRNLFLSEMFRMQSHAAMSLFATSRPIVDIEAQFEDPLTLPISANNDDICIYIDANLDKLLPFVSRNLRLQTEIKNAITTAVEGMFLLAQLYLTSLEDKTTVKAIRSSIEQFQKQAQGIAGEDKDKILSEAYDHAMDRIDGQRPGFRQLAMKVLQWISRAKSPLGKAALQHAIAVDIGEDNLDEDNIPQIEDMVSVCAGLVTLDKESDVVRLVHYTTQDYLEKTHMRWFANSEVDMTDVCATYLSYETFQSGRCEHHRDYVARMQQYPFYDYAVRQWARHAVLLPEVSQEVISFLTKPQNADAAAQCFFAGAAGRVGESSRRNPSQVTGLHLAAYFQLERELAELVKVTSEIDQVDSCNQTVLSWAAETGFLNGCALLLATERAAVDSVDDMGRTPLIYAAKMGHTEIVRLLITNGVGQIHTRDGEGRNALVWACLGKRWETATFLLESGADANVRCRNGRTPLSIAVQAGEESMVAALLSVDGLEADTKDIAGLSPLLIATAFGRDRIVTMLADHLGQIPRVQSLRPGAAKRVVREVLAHNSDPPPYIFPVEMVGQDLRHFRATMLGPDDSPYENGLFTLNYEFPSDYPFKPPNVEFVTPIFHPNISHSGVIRITLLGKEWSPIANLSSTLLSIWLALGSPLLDEANTDAATLCRNNYGEFELRAREMTQLHAM